MNLTRYARFARRILAPAVLGASVGCDPLASGGGGGCEPAPIATDASFNDVQLVNASPPCRAGHETIRGAATHLWVTLNCHGEGNAFLVAVSIDGKLAFLQPAAPAGYGTLVTLDAGPWTVQDTLWHRVDVVIDPLNVFVETDEANNRGSVNVRSVDPDASIDGASCGFVIPYPQGDGWTLVDHVPAGTEVETQLRLSYGGAYSGVVRSVRSGATVLATDTTVYAACDQPLWPVENMAARWTPPGPGVYDVEFRITPLGGLPNRPANDVVVKRLTVTASSPAVPPARGRNAP